MIRSKISTPMTASSVAISSKSEGDSFDHFMAWLTKRFFPNLLYTVFIIALSQVLFCTILILLSDHVHGETLASFSSSVVDESVEYSAIFTMDGQIFYETCSNSENRVATPAAVFICARIVGGGEFIHAHNHPAKMARPSVADILSYTHTRPAKAIVIAKETQCILEAPQGWPSADAVKEYLAGVTKAAVLSSREFVYCASGDYIELFNYPDLVSDFLRTFDLRYYESSLT